MKSRSAIDLGGLDALRGMLAIYVLIGHARWLLWAGHSAWMATPHPVWQEALVYASGAFRYGREAVLIFFALSGFFIHLRAAESLRDGRGAPLMLGRYARRRAHRLAPTYYMALVLTLACDAIGRWQFPTLYDARTGDALLDGVFANGGYSTASVVPALAMLPTSLGRDFGSNGPLWSLGYEVVYYAIYPVWLAVRRVSAAAAYLGAPVVCLAVLTLAPGSFLSSVLGWYPVWLCGAGVVELATLARTPGRILGATLFAAGLAGYVLADEAAVKVLCAVVFAGGAVGAWVSVQATTGIAVRVAEYLGRRSYTIYAMHFPVLALLSAATFETAGARPFHGALAVAGVFIAVGVCLILFQLCERHFLHERLTLGARAAA
jgi:peptidoglycan/LPS O-acetylase OafA/YrhL